MLFTEAQQRETFRRMLRIRKFEEEGSRLFRSGKIYGAFHASIGQEAAIVIIGESAIVGGGIPLATGCGLSAKVRGTDQVALCFFGDGAVNQGTFHESLNMASLWKLPVLYFCENNGYAITTSVARSHGQPDIAKRAEAYGMPGVVVDGQDVRAVYQAASEATTRARRGDGPTLIEAKTYRFDEHSVALHTGSKRPYRPAEEVEEYKTHRDPIGLFRQVLLAEGFSDADLSELEGEVVTAVNEAVRFAEASPTPDPGTLYDYMYSNPIHYPANPTA
jgi:acetoin:2,6-dichlorophenolindophenol oxidoreductase subunit alpha